MMNEIDFLRFILINQHDLLKKRCKNLENLIIEINNDHGGVGFFNGVKQSAVRELDFLNFLADSIPMNLINEMPELDHPPLVKLNKDDPPQ